LCLARGSFVTLVTINADLTTNQERREIFPR
jgi:hypothetical protein